MLDSKASKPPCTLWAQRKNKVFITIELGDCKNPTIELQADKLFFKGTSNSIQAGTDHNERQVTIEFYKPINVDESKYNVRDRATEFVIVKDEVGWWPRLLKEPSKQHWLKIDFPKWKDEDESEEETDGMAGMGGMPGMGMPGMGMGGGPSGGDFSEFMKQMQMSGQMPDFDDDDEEGVEDDGEDEDDEDDNGDADVKAAKATGAAAATVNGDSSSKENKQDSPPPLS